MRAYRCMIVRKTSGGRPMSKICAAMFGALTMAVVCVCGANAQSTDKAKDDAIRAHTAAATAAAKEDFKGSLNMCVPPAPPGQRGARGAGGGGGQRGAQPPSDVVPAARAFD